jgi:diguanylate cyclase
VKSRGEASQKRPAHRLRILLWAMIFSLICGVIEFGEPLEDLWRGARNWIVPRPADGRVVVVALDDDTIKAYGTERFSRREDAKLIDNLFAKGARRVFFDRPYGEASDPEGDDAFAAALARHKGKVYLGAVQLPDIKSGRKMTMLPNMKFRQSAIMASLNGFLTPFRLSAKFPYASNINGQVIPSISSEISGVKGPVEVLFRPDWSIQISTIPTFSLLKVVQGKIPENGVRGKDILVGITSMRGNDYHRVMGQGWQYGVYFHAIGAQTLREGNPTKAGWVPAYLIFLLGALFILFSPSAAMRRVFIAVGLMVLVGGPFVCDYFMVDADFIPSLLLFGIVAYRSATLHAIRRGKVHNETTDLPTLAMLQETEQASHFPIIVMKISNYAEIYASFDEDIEAQLMRAIIDRIELTGPNPTFYQGENQLCWLGPDIPTWEMEDHLRGLARLIETSVSIEHRRIDLELVFGIDDERERPVKRRIASAEMAARDASRRRLIVSTYNRNAQVQTEWHLSIIGEMEDAIQSGDIWVAYQPQLDMRQSRICGAEALVRWNHPKRGTIPTDEFILAAESHNRIERLTAHVMRTAMQDCLTIIRFDPEFKIAVNISAILLNDIADFSLFVRDLADQTQFPLQNLSLEVTETAQIIDDKRGVQALTELAGYGVTIAIDDYGTGNASLSYLRDFPANEIKIDRSFITNITTDSGDALMVESTIALIHGLNKLVIAEGIEDEATLALLGKFGCDIAQGYLIGKPRSFADLLHQLTRNDRAKAG